CRRAGEQVVGQAQLLEVLGDHQAVPVGELTGGHALPIGLHLDRRAVLVGTAHHEHVVPRQPLVAAEHVGRDAEPGDMADVPRTIGVRPRHGGQDVSAHSASLSMSACVNQRLAATTASKTSRLGTPCAAATEAIASLRDWPPASRSETSAASAAASGAVLTTDAPPTTSVSSPRTSPAAHVASSPRPPRRTCSYFLVSSRHTAAGRAAPNALAISDSVAASRCGASKNTSVRGSAANEARVRRRSPARRGRKPSKQNRSTGSPDTASAAVTADGPGSTVTSMPSAMAATTRRYPGSDTDGIPASVTTSTSSPARNAESSDGSR